MSFTPETKNGNSFSAQSIHAGTFTSQTIHTGSFSSQSIHTSSFAAQTPGVVTGLWDVSVFPWQLLLPWQHSGTAQPIWTSQTKN